MVAYNFLPATTSVYRAVQGCFALKVDNAVRLCEYDTSLARYQCVCTHTGVYTKGLTPERYIQLYILVHHKGIPR